MTKLHLYITLLVLTALFTQCKDDAVQPARNQLIIVFPHDSIVKVNLVNCIASGDFILILVLAGKVQIAQITVSLCIAQVVVMGILISPIKRVVFH